VVWDCNEAQCEDLHIQHRNERATNNEAYDQQREWTGHKTVDEVRGETAGCVGQRADRLLLLYGGRKYVEVQRQKGERMVTAGKKMGTRQRGTAKGAHKARTRGKATANGQKRRKRRTTTDKRRNGGQGATKAGGNTSELQRGDRKSSTGHTEEGGKTGRGKKEGTSGTASTSGNNTTQQTKQKEDEARDNSSRKDGRGSDTKQETTDKS
jgi:hypothetical protein